MAEQVDRHVLASAAVVKARILQRLRRRAEVLTTDRGSAWLAAGLYLVGWACLTAALAGVVPRITGARIQGVEVVLLSAGVLALSYGGVAPLLVFVWEGVRFLVKEGQP